ncbi:MAG: hypothetical protein QM757_39285 [Paludibaculum sp.]
MCLTLFYTFEGGITAVIWTDVVQMILFHVGGAIVSLFVILGKIPGGWPEVWQSALQADKLHVFDFHFAWSMEFFKQPYSFRCCSDSIVFPY